jgi:hypothetical protein
MHVTNWVKWTRVKKKTIIVLYVVGIALGFTIESASLWWGVLGIMLCFVGAIVISTIRYHEW